MLLRNSTFLAVSGLSPATQPWQIAFVFNPQVSQQIPHTPTCILFSSFCFIELMILYKFTSFQMRGSKFHIIPSIYDVATKGSNVPKGKGISRSVYAVLYEALPYCSFNFSLCQNNRSIFARVHPFIVRVKFILHV